MEMGDERREAGGRNALGAEMTVLDPTSAYSEKKAPSSSTALPPTRHDAIASSVTDDPPTRTPRAQA